MEDNISKIVKQIQALSNDDFEKLVYFIFTVSSEEQIKNIDITSESITDYTKNIREITTRKCPYCGGDHIVRNGHRKDGVQKLTCKECGRSFVPSTNSGFYHTHKDIVTWSKFFNCFLEQKDLRESAMLCNINLKTAFYWRHKISSVLVGIEEEVSINGIAESDETYIPLSFKGNHKVFEDETINRLPRERGASVHKRGLSKEQICIPCVVDRENKSYAKAACLGECSKEALDNVLGGRVEEGSTLCTDGNKLYRKFAKVNKLQLVQLKGGKTKKGIFHIQHMNNYHSILKNFLRNFKGVASKYVNHYLAYNNFLKYAKENIHEKFQILKESMVKINSTMTQKLILSMPSIPF